MKRLFYICSFLLTLGSLSLAQNYNEAPRPGLDINLEVSNLTARSIYGWKTGFTIGATLNNRISLSYVNLMELNGGEYSGDTFSGGSFQYFFNPKRPLGFGLGMMVGFYNQQFLTVTPSVEVRYLYKKRLVAGIGYARVDGYPKFDFKVGIRIFK